MNFILLVELHGNPYSPLDHGRQGFALVSHAADSFKGLVAGSRDFLRLYVYRHRTFSPDARIQQQYRNSRFLEAFPEENGFPVFCVHGGDKKDLAGWFHTSLLFTN